MAHKFNKIMALDEKLLDLNYRHTMDEHNLIDDAQLQVLDQDRELWDKAHKILMKINYQSISTKNVHIAYCIIIKSFIESRS